MRNRLLKFSKIAAFCYWDDRRLLHKLKEEGNGEISL
jgi:hypothetical protein